MPVGSLGGLACQRMVLHQGTTAACLDIAQVSAHACLELTADVVHWAHA